MQVARRHLPGPAASPRFPGAAPRGAVRQMSALSVSVGRPGLPQPVASRVGPQAERSDP
jgi:hypothetical protein